MNGSFSGPPTATAVVPRSRTAKQEIRRLSRSGRKTENPTLGRWPSGIPMDVSTDCGRSYKLARDEGVAAGLTRVAAECAEAALERLRAATKGEVDAAEAVHGARKDLKKLRTVLRL